MELSRVLRRWFAKGLQAKMEIRHRLRLEALEERRLLACVSDDPFICTPLQPTHEGLAMHIHPTLSIFIDGVEQEIPADVGVLKNGSATTGFYPLHTHDDTGTIHAEGPVVRDFLLEHFFAVWEKPFDSTRVLDFVADSNDTISMTVNGAPNTQYGDLVLKDGDQIVITATSVANPDPEPTPFSGKIFAVGDATGRVQVRRATDGTIQADFGAYGEEYQGPISVAVGDVNGDGFEDIVTGPLRATPHVKVFDGKAIKEATFDEDNPDAHLLASWMAYGVQFNVGVYVAVGKIASAEGDVVDIITGASVGNPHVKIYRGSAIKDSTFNSNPESYLVASFFPYQLNVNYGATVASGVIAGTDHADLVCGTTVGNPHVKVYKGFALGHGEFNNFNPDASLLSSFFAFDTNRNLGVHISVGDTNNDGFADVVCGSFANSSQVKVYDGEALKNGTAGDAALLEQFFAYEGRADTGVTVGAADFNNDGKAEILTGTTQGNATYRVIDASTASGNNPPALMENTVAELSTIISVSAPQ